MACISAALSYWQQPSSVEILTPLRIENSELIAKQEA